ncbi:hypothetical protein [Anaerospora sp.]|uniref:hypothetical protein n=1 Tax=Anaerospora sp. TaxID=1960278 RepID=UPI00289C4859|nr:hypothetical protein [Anaerospora sp.]
MTISTLNDWVRRKSYIRYKGISIAGIYLIFLVITITAFEISIDLLDDLKSASLYRIQEANNASIESIAYIITGDKEFYRQHPLVALTNAQTVYKSESDFIMKIDYGIDIYKRIKYGIIVIPNVLFSLSVITQENKNLNIITAWLRLMGVLALCGLALFAVYVFYFDIYLVMRS